MSENNNKKAPTTLATTIDNVWDDSLLIKAYDNSVKLSREELARRIASNTSKLTPEGNHRIYNNAVLTEMATADQTNNSTENTSEYKVGDYCRATYEDGVDYEAKIISINHSDGTCLLKYVGYENEQEVLLPSLVPSWGKKARRLQFAKAKVDEYMYDVQNVPKVSAMEKNTKNNTFIKGNVNIPPPPPLPPMLNADNNGEDSEHLSAMLMSWYMSGYYTGVYHGMQMSKSSIKSKK